MASISRTNEKQQPSSSSTPEAEPLAPQQQFLTGNPSEAESYFKTPYWRLSYDFPYNPDPLCRGNNYDIYDEMRDDDQVKSAVTIKKDMIVNSGWKIQGEGNRAEEAALFITDNLEHIGEMDSAGVSFDEVMRNILTSFDYGFSISEPVYELINGQYYYKHIKTRAPHSFKFYMSDKGEIERLTQMTNNKEHELKPELFLHYVYQSDFGNPFGKSDLRSAYAPWKAKKFFNKFYAMYVERYACPTAIAKYPKVFSATEIDELNKIITSIKTATGATVPEDVVIEFLQNTRDSGDSYLRGLDYYNMQIARSILMPDLLGLGGTQTKGGSYALGKEQFKLFLSILKKEREALARKLTLKIIRPLAQYNFGDFPIWFEFNSWTFEDIKEYLKLWIEAVTNKIYEPNDEEISYFRTSLGFPDGQVIRPEPPPAPIMQVAGDIAPPDNKQKEIPEGKPAEVEKEPEEAGEINEKEDIGEEEEEKEEDEREYAINDRPLTKYEKRIDYKKIKETIDTFDERLVSRLTRSAKAIYSDLLIQVREKGLLKKFKPESLETLKPKYLKDMNMLFKNNFTELFKKSYESARKELFPDNDKKYALQLLPDEFLELIKAESFKLVGDYSTDITKKVKNIVMQGIKDGWNEADILSVARDELDGMSERWLQTVVRTKSTEIYNEARKKYWENDEYASQIVEAYQWSSILDDRTSDICQYLDGKIFDVETSQSVKPPAHFNCRSILVPITKMEDYKSDPNYEKGFNLDKLVDKGGGLLKPGGSSSSASKYAFEYTILRYNATLNTFGDVVAVAASGVGKTINITRVYANNGDVDNPVTVSFNSSESPDQPLKATLEKSGGTFNREFSPPWTLREGENFIVSLSAPITTNIEIEYYISPISIQVVV